VGELIAAAVGAAVGFLVGAAVGFLVGADVTAAVQPTWLPSLVFMF